MEEYYEEKVNRYRVYKKRADKYAREDEPWMLEWSFVNKSDADEKAENRPSYESAGLYVRKVVDNGEASTIKRGMW